MLSQSQKGIAAASRAALVSGTKNSRKQQPAQKKEPARSHTIPAPKGFHAAYDFEEEEESDPIEPFAQAGPSRVPQLQMVASKSQTSDPAQMCYRELDQVRRKVGTRFPFIFLKD